MIDFRAIPRQSLAGKLLRWPLGLIPHGLTVPICQGRLRGKKWIVGAAQHGCWLGSYECRQQRHLARIIKPGWVFFDVGANVGFYSLLASTLVREEGWVYAFEPVPRNLSYLRRHIALNDIRNIIVFDAAVADTTREDRFEEALHCSMGRLSDTGKLVVKTLALDELFRQGAVPLPNIMKIDVEGAEALVLRGAQAILQQGEPILYLSTHGSEAHDGCLRLLKTWGYHCWSFQESHGRGLTWRDELIAVKDSGQEDIVASLSPAGLARAA